MDKDDVVIYIWYMEKAMAPHSSTLAWKIPWTEEPLRLQSMGSLRVGHDWVTSLSLFTSCIGEGNGNPLQCSSWRIPGTGEPGGLPSMGSHRVGHDWSDLAAAAVHAKSLQLCPTLCDPVDYSQWGSSVRGILHGQESWNGFHALLQGSSWPRNRTHVS